MKKKILAISLVVSLVAVAALGVTLAYFTDTGKVDNTFTVGNIDIALSETVANDGEQPQTITEEDGEFEYDTIVPGDVLTKEPVIENTGDNDAYVFMKLTLSDAAALGGLLPSAEGAVTDGLINFNGTDWTPLDNDVVGTNRVIWIGYKTVLASGATTNAPFSTITIPTEWNSTDMGGLGDEFSLTVEAYAIQADNITSLTVAYTALQGELL